MNDLGSDNCLLLSCVIAQLEIFMQNVYHKNYSMKQKNVS